MRPRECSPTRMGTALFVLAVTLAGGCYARAYHRGGYVTTGYSGDAYVVTQAPPSTPGVVYAAVTPPYAGAQWVEGHWEWDGYQYVWIDGYWIEPRAGYSFVQPRWEQRGSGHVYVEGGWRDGSGVIVSPPPRHRSATVVVEPPGRPDTVVVTPPRRDPVVVTPPRRDPVVVSPPSRGSVIVAPPSRGSVTVTPPRHGGAVTVTPPRGGGVVVTPPR
jgi:hypothetical protein